MKSLLFDYGGTLDSDGTTWLERFYPIYKENGVVADRARFDRAFYDADDSLPQRFALDGLDLEQTLRLQVRGVLDSLAPERADLTAPIAARFAEDSRRQFRLLKPVLERLASRYRLGVVSNFYGNLDGILRAEGLRGHFSVVADSGVLGCLKPDPEIFLHAARALDSRPEECVMIGDSINRDIKGAAAAGMKKALVCAAPQAPDAGQDWTVRTVVDLEALRPMSFAAGMIAAGEGSRLSLSHPGTVKPLVPVAGRPLSHWVAGTLRAAGARGLTVLTNSRGAAVPASLSSAFPGFAFDFLTADTASSYESFRLVARRLAEREDAFLISTVDALVPAEDVARFWAECRAARADAGLALTAHVDDEKPLWADVDEAGLVSALGEDARTRRRVTCGLYFLTRAAAEKLPEPGEHARLRDFWRTLVAAGARVSGPTLSKTLDVDRPEDVAAAEAYLTTETKR